MYRMPVCCGWFIPSQVIHGKNDCPWTGHLYVDGNIQEFQDPPQSPWKDSMEKDENKIFPGHVLSF